jgi:translation elongation factor EF-Tu-like GTPase
MHQIHRPLAIALALLAAACSKSEPPAAKPAEPVRFQAQAPIPVTVTLLKAEGQTGRSSPIENNYRPQVKFPLGPTEAMCAVQLPASAPSLAPGESSSATLVCDADVRVERTQPEFVATEGGKQVATGRVQWP